MRDRPWLLGSHDHEAPDEVAVARGVVLGKCENHQEQNDDGDREGPWSGPGVRVHLPMCAGAPHRGPAHDVTPGQDEVTALKWFHTS